MGMPAAKKGDRIVGVDMHMVQLPNAVVTTVPMPFNGIIDNGLSSDVYIGGQPAATVDSTATNTPSHIPTGGTFVNQPSNKATIKIGSTSVYINNKAAARSGDTANTCNDPSDLPSGSVVAAGTVFIG